MKENNRKKIPNTHDHSKLLNLHTCCEVITLMKISRENVWE